MGSKWISGLAIFMVLSAGQAPEKAPVGPGQRARGGPPAIYDLRIKLVPTKNEYLQGEPVNVRVEITNESVSTLVYDSRCSNYRLLELYAYKDGELAQRTQYYEAARSNRMVNDHRFLDLGKNQPLEFDIYPSIIFDMTRPGEYRIVVGMPSKECVEGNVQVVYSKPVTIRIVERNRF